jgi:hypothetical protein
VKWCEINDVRVYAERGRKFTSRIEFLAALERPFIRSLKKKYGSKWREVYQVMETSDAAELVDYQDDSSASIPSPLHEIVRYRPKGIMSKSFLEKINKK